MDAVAIVGVTLAIALIVVGMVIRGNRTRRVATGDDGGFAWVGGDSGGSSDCTDGGSSGGGECGGGDGGGGGD